MLLLSSLLLLAFYVCWHPAVAGILLSLTFQTFLLLLVFWLLLDSCCCLRPSCKYCSFLAVAGSYSACTKCTYWEFPAVLPMALVGSVISGLPEKNG
jgi:hypothetical protein